MPSVRSRPSTRPIGRAFAWGGQGEGNCSLGLEGDGGKPQRFYRVAPVSAAPGPTLHFASPVVPGTNRVNFALEGIAGFNYTVLTSADLINWTPLTNFTGNAGTMYFQDVTGASTRKFYRALAQ